MAAFGSFLRMARYVIKLCTSTLWERAACVRVGDRWATFTAPPSFAERPACAHYVTMVCVRDIAEGRKWKDQVLLAELTTHASLRHLHPEKLPFVSMDVKDAEGSIATLLVAHVSLYDTPVAEIQRMYPNGALISLLNTQPADISLFHAKNPTSLIVKNPSLLKVRSFFSAEALQVYSLMDAAQLRKEGNTYFSREHFQAAAQLYGMSIDKARSCEDALLALSNRAECYLKMGMWTEAEADCNEALKVHPQHDKTLFRLGKALFHVHEYEESCKVLSKAAELNSRDASIRAALAKSQVFLAQSTTGKYGDFLEEFIMTGSKWDDAPDCPEYVGPVEVQMTKDGRGRGLFATKDVKAGALIMVSKAMTFVKRKEAGPFDLNQQAVTKLVKVCMKSKEALGQIYMLHDEAREKGSLVIPPMCLFGPNRRKRGLMNFQGHYQENLPIDVGRIARIFESTSYGSRIYGSGIHSANYKESNLCFVGLWVVPAFINHSCIANMSKIEVGDTAFFHACRDIKAGDELTIDYFTLCLPWSTFRRKKLQEGYGFECNCRMCSTESKYNGQLKHAAKVMAAFGEELMTLEGTTKLHALASCAVEVENAIVDADEDEKSYIRASYVFAYRGYYELQKQGATVPAGLIPRPEVLAGALRFCAPGKITSIFHVAHLTGYLYASDFWMMIGHASGRPHVVFEMQKQVMNLSWSWMKEGIVKDRKP